MFSQAAIGVIAILEVALASPSGGFISPIGGFANVSQKNTLASHDLDLTKRLTTEYGSQVFADNILLALHYLKGDISTINTSMYSQSVIDWGKAREPFNVQFTLKPGDVFAFHANVLPEFSNPNVTMNSKFYMEEGYKALEGLGGNGVCHLASLINWVASNAGLEVIAKVNHDFYPVPGVPRENGTSIMSTSAAQNLYIKNTRNVSITFNFQANSKNVRLEISE